MTLVADDAFRPYASIPEMVAVTIDERIATAAIKKQGFGGLWHVINHAAAITEMDRYGFKELAKQALPAQPGRLRNSWRIPLPAAKFPKHTAASKLTKNGQLDCWPLKLKGFDI